MTATDELRRLLDERGADYRVSATGYSIDIGPYITAYANRSDTTLDVSLRQVTPEQAIAATLGDTDATAERRGDAGTCRDEGDPGDFCCSECGVRMFTDTSDTYTMIASDGRTIIEHPNFCPNCGRRWSSDGSVRHAFNRRD